MPARPTRLRAAFAAVGAAALVTACSGGSGSKSLATVTTVQASTSTSMSTTSTSTTVVATTTSVVSPSTQPTPEAQANSFYDAWTKGDRAAAAALGEPEAVATIFARPWSAGDGWSFSECSGAAGSVICAWDGGAGQLLLKVRNATGGLPVTVTEVRFV